ALFSPLDHRLCGADLSLTNGSGSLDINDDAELDINEIIIGIGKECWPAHRTGPLRGRISRRDELRCHIARRTKIGIIKGRQIFSRGAARGLGDACLLPFDADRCLLASATMRLASTANPSPPTKPAAIQVSTTYSKTRRNASLSRNRS